MKKRNRQDDNWDLLASELGIGEGGSVSNSDSKAERPEIASPESGIVQEQKQNAAALKKKETPETKSSFGAGLLDNLSPPAAAETSESNKDAFPTPLPDVSQASADSKDHPASSVGEPKKTLFGRFPRINLFGSAPKESSAPLGDMNRPVGKRGSSFTSKTVEKVPLSPNLAERLEHSADSAKPSKSKNQADEKDANQAKPNKPRNSKTDAGSPSPAAQIAQSLDPWSQIASQVGILSEPPSVENTDSTSNAPDRSTPKPDRKTGRTRDRKEKPEETKRGRKSLPSLFDDAPAETEESIALKNLIEDSESLDEEVKRLDSIFNDGDEETKSPSSAPRQPESRSSRRRHRQDREKVEDVEDFDTFSKNVSVPPPSRNDGTASTEDDSLSSQPSRQDRPRGRRGSRFVQRTEERTEDRAEKRIDERTEKQFVEEAVDSIEEFEGAAWDIEEESNPVERSRKEGRRRDRKPEKELRNADRRNRKDSNRRDTNDAESFHDREDSFTVEEPVAPSQSQKTIPSWSDAISVIIEANKARRAQKNNESRRGRR